MGGGASSNSFQINGDTVADYVWSKFVVATGTAGLSQTSCLMETTASALD